MGGEGEDRILCHFTCLLAKEKQDVYVNNSLRFREHFAREIAGKKRKKKLPLSMWCEQICFKYCLFLYFCHKINIEKY